MYIYTLIIGHTSCNMLSLLKKVSLQQELQNFVTNNVFLEKKIKQKNSCWSRELDPRHLALKADALALHHRVN